MANGVRQIFLLLIPSAVLMAVLAEPITRLVYQRGAFGAHATDLVTAMVWWSISLPFQGVSLLFSRTFFSLQRPWATTALAGVNLVVNAGLAAALYGPVRRGRHRDRHCRRDRGDVPGPGRDPAPRARRHRGRPDARQRAAHARGRRAAGRGGLRRLVRARRPARALARGPGGGRGRRDRRGIRGLRGRGVGAARARGAPAAGAAAAAVRRARHEATMDVEKQRGSASFPAYIGFLPNPGALP